MSDDLPLNEGSEDMPSSDPAVVPEVEVSPVDDHDTRSSSDAVRIALAVGVLATVAVIAVAIGLSRKASNETRSDTTGSASPAAGTGTTPTTRSGAGGICVSGSWPRSFLSRPVAAEMTEGVYIWNDNPGWKLRVVDPAATTFTGTITATHDLDPRAFKLTSEGIGNVSVKANRATFDVKASATPTGVDFGMPCAVFSIRVEVLSGDGTLLAAEAISIGKDGAALTNPLVIHKLTD